MVTLKVTYGLAFAEFAGFAAQRVPNEAGFEAICGQKAKAKCEAVEHGGTSFRFVIITIKVKLDE